MKFKQGKNNLRMWEVKYTDENDKVFFLTGIYSLHSIQYGQYDHAVSFQNISKTTGNTQKKESGP